MEMATLEKAENLTSNTSITFRDKHRWKQREGVEVCVFCGTIRTYTYMDNGWKVYEYADPETGEIFNSRRCKTNQIQLNF